MIKRNRFDSLTVKNVSSFFIENFWFQKLKKSSISQNISTIFFIIKTKSILSASVFIFSFIFISQILETKFYDFVQKHVEIGPNCSHEIPNILKYHMPLRNCFLFRHSAKIKFDL